MLCTRQIMIDRRTFATAMVAFVLTYQPALAQDGKDEKIKVPKYVPMRKGAPGGRIGGATRGEPPETLKILALAPDHVAYTALAQPTVHWFLSEPVPRVFFVLTAGTTQTAPIVTKEITGQLAKGVLAVRFADLGVTLDPETVYEWTIRTDAADGAIAPLLSKGLIAYRPASAKLVRQVEKAKAVDAFTLNVTNGYWYDAVDAVGRLIAENPSTRAHRLLRAGLMEQVRLFDVADYDQE